MDWKIYEYTIILWEEMCICEDIAMALTSTSSLFHMQTQTSVLTDRTHSYVIPEKVKRLYTHI